MCRAFPIKHITKSISERSGWIRRYRSEPFDGLSRIWGRLLYSCWLFSSAAPGAVYDYCNVGYALLGYIVEQVAGQDLRTFTQERMFTPLACARFLAHCRCASTVSRHPYEVVDGRAVATQPSASRTIRWACSAPPSPASCPLSRRQQMAERPTRPGSCRPPIRPKC